MHDGIKPIMARTQVTIDNANDARTRMNDSGATPVASTYITPNP
jgi:hypothetical protein